VYTVYSQVLLAAAHTPSVSLSPRLMAERQLTLVGGGAPSKPEMLAYLSAFEVRILLLIIEILKIEQ